MTPQCEHCDYYRQRDEWGGRCVVDLAPWLSRVLPVLPDPRPVAAWDSCGWFKGRA